MCIRDRSLSVEKHTKAIKGRESAVALADRTNMVFSGSLVTSGRAMAVVTATGMGTEIGKIASLMNETKEKKTPLQVSLDRFSGRLAMAIIAICGLVFLLSLYRREPVLDALMFAVALAVAAIPEALSSIVTIVQAMGTQKMAKEQAIICLLYTSFPVYVFQIQIILPLYPVKNNRSESNHCGRGTEHYPESPYFCASICSISSFRYIQRSIFSSSSFSFASFSAISSLSLV